MLSTFLLFLGSSVLFCHAQWEYDEMLTPPSMRSSFEQEYYVGTGNVKFSVSCVADGTPDIKYTWKMNGIPINDTLTRNVFPNGTLFISTSNAVNKPYGVYQCFASNSQGGAMSTKFTLREPALQSFTSTQVFHMPRVNEYTYLSMKCNNRSECIPDSACRTEWKIGEGTEHSVVTNDRIALDADGTLHFLHLRREDQVSSFYGCALWNGIMSLLRKGSHTTLVITPIDNPPNHQIETRYTNGATGLLGKSATLQCIFSGYPVPTISWFKRKDGPEIVVGDGERYELTESNRKLVIKKLEAGDEMMYKCVGSQGEDKKSSLVFLNVTGPPQPKAKQMTDAIVPKGTDAKFSCDTFSLQEEEPPVGPFWYLNGVEIKQAEIDYDSKYSTEQNGAVLVVHSVLMDYTGSFQCMTYNSEGTFMRDAVLVVIEPIVIDLSPPSTIEILPEEKHYLQVGATTDPLFTLKYSWSYTNQDGKVYVNNDTYNNFPEQLQLSSDRQNLTLDGSQLQGSEIFDLVGIFTLRVYHQHDEVTIVTDVSTDASITPAPVVITTAGGFNPIIIAIILGVIVLFIVIFLIACLLYRNRGGTYPLDKKELAAGHDPEKELADSGFHDLSRADGFDDEKPHNDGMSLNDSDKEYDSDDDLDQEYGADFDTSKFNEDGSFIGQYSERKRQPPNQSVV